MNFNIIIAQRERQNHLEACLHYLNKANAESKHNVRVYVSNDCGSIVQGTYNNLTITAITLPSTEAHFNKSKLLNHSLSGMSSDFDFVSVVDLDILYCSDFFDRLVEESATDTWIVSNGFKLIEEGSQIVIQTKPDFAKISEYVDSSLIKESNSRAYPSQITLSKSLYHKVLNILSMDRLYCDEFIGWGGEDSHLSLVSYIAERNGLLKKKYLDGIWCHLYHTKTISTDCHNHNKELLIKKVEEGKHRVNEYKDRYTNSYM